MAVLHEYGSTNFPLRVDEHPPNTYKAYMKQELSQLDQIEIKHKLDLIDHFSKHIRQNKPGMGVAILALRSKSLELEKIYLDFLSRQGYEIDKGDK